MVLFLLAIKADLENVSNVHLVRDANLCLSVRNPLSDFETRDRVTVDPSATLEELSREGPHHFRLSWEGSKKASTLAVLSDAEAKTALKKKKNAPVPRDITEQDSGEWVPILAVECRGLEPFAFFPMGNEFVVTSAGGTAFSEDVDFSEGDWADYDADHDLSVSVSSIQFRWESV